MSRSVYGAAERAQLEGLADQITATNAAAMNALGPAIADRLRQKLPDLGDVAIGRVLVAIGTEFPQLFMPDSAVLWAGFTAAGLQMTEAEWQ
jgi:hypothetical protein